MPTMLKATLAARAGVAPAAIPYSPAITLRLPQTTGLLK